ncbi:MAG: glucose 1-dehydrogenase [Eubacteriales bacterium]|nr:glucose 1-dehydrogenase [Eubacteriales bacterium]
MAASKIFDVADKIVLITGAGSGLGQGYALTFGGAGAVVACAGRKMAALEETVKAIEAAGGRAKAFQADVTDRASIAALVKAVTDEYGRLDVLVNNAGYENIQPFLEVTPEVYDDIMSVNMKGAFFMAQEAARAMKETGGGKIINIGSLGSYIGLAESSVYCSTKGGIIQLTKTMALELGEFNIQVNALAPGYFITPMTQPFYDDPKHRAWIESRIPLHQWGTNEDLAGPVLFLASSASNYVTGVTIKVDGGWLAS